MFGVSTVFAFFTGRTVPTTPAGRSLVKRSLGAKARATIRAMAKDENSNGSSPNGGRPYLGLSDAARAEQQESLSELLDELIAEGATLGRYLPRLEAEAATWPE